MYLFSPVDDILRVVQSTSTWSAYHRVVAGRGVSYPHRRQLLHRLAEGHTTQQQSSGNNRERKQHPT